MNVIIHCPECGAAPMVRRTNHQNGGEFYGCQAWPSCKCTVPVPEYVKLRERGAPPLPLEGLL